MLITSATSATTIAGEGRLTCMSFLLWLLPPEGTRLLHEQCGRPGPAGAVGRARAGLDRRPFDQDRPRGRGLDVDRVRVLDAHDEGLGGPVLGQIGRAHG